MAEETTFSDVLAVILAIIFLAYAYNSVMPRVSYVKLLDLYMCSCFLFVFLSLTKLVIIKYLCKKWARENNRSSDWFLAQMAGISMAQQQQQQQQNGDVEKGVRSQDRSRRTSAMSRNSDTSSGDTKNGPEANGPMNLIVPPLAHQRARRSQKAKKSNVVIIREPPDSDSEPEDYKSAMDQSGIMAKQKGSDEESLETGPFLMTNSDMGDAAKDEQSSEEEKYTPGDRKMTFLGLEAFSAWFEEKNKKKESELERKMRFLRWFHVMTQLMLPLGFGAFFIFLLLVYPNVPDKRGC